VPDKLSVEAFWTDAENLFETARQASQSGSPDCDLAILIGPKGDIRMLDAAGWTLPSLLASNGGETAYRVTREGGHVCLEGRRGSQTCLLRSESSSTIAHHLLESRLAAGIARIAPSLALLGEGNSTLPTREIWKMFA
jgi:hypothetical protein